jgi:hypothetical protein
MEEEIEQVATPIARRRDDAMCPSNFGGKLFTVVEENLLDFSIFCTDFA